MKRHNVLENDPYDWEKCNTEELLTINATTAQQLTRLTPAYLGYLQPKPLIFTYYSNCLSPSPGHHCGLTFLLHSMANASVLPGELQRENTEDVLQGERLSDADICPPVPTPAPLVPGGEAWEDRNHASNQKQPTPIIRKVRAGLALYFWCCFLNAVFQLMSFFLVLCVRWRVWMSGVRNKATTAPKAALRRTLLGGCDRKPCSWNGLCRCSGEWSTARAWH